MKKFRPAITPVCIALVLGILFFALVSYGNKYEERKYSLVELSNNTYGWYYRVSSRVPAQNYEVITLCCDGSIVTFQGDVNIVYTDQNPYVVVKDYNIVNADEICVYVPKGTISFQENVGV